MDMRRIAIVGAIALLAGTLVLAEGCVRVDLDEDSSTTHSTEKVDLGDAEEVHVSIDMGAGGLVVASDPTLSLMEGDFTYRPSSLEPRVEYTIHDGSGALSVKTPGSIQLNLGVSMRYAWEIRLAEDVPMSLDVNMGAGESNLDLGDLTLTALKVDLGAGDATIDLSGDPKQDLDADINAGIGQLTLIVPRDAGVRIVGYKDGVGAYQADGFTIDGDALENDAYETSDVTYDITLRRGVGEVIIQMAD